MKTPAINKKYTLAVVLLIIFTSGRLYAQDLLTGTWEGYFMNDFKTILTFSTTDGNNEGAIRMFSGNTEIQNDALSEISIIDQVLTFYIKAKETRFNGKIGENNEQVSGNFIFPDGSEHPFTAKKVHAESIPVKKEVKSKPNLTGQVFSPEELRSDLDCLLKMLKENHPTLYKYTGEAAMMQEYKLAKDNLNASMRLENYYAILAPFIAKIGCSHTGIRLPSEYQHNLEQNSNYFPLQVFIQNEQLFAVSGIGPGAEDILPGTEITSINNISSSDIIKKLLAMIPAEGQLKTTKYNEINHHFHHWFYFLDHSDHFLVGYMNKEMEGALDIPACSYNEIAQQPAAPDQAVPLSFQYNEAMKAEFIRLSSFAIRDMERYLFLLDSVFSALEETNVKTLVLDFRDNAGGHPIFAAQLLSYLTEKEFTYFRKNPDVNEFEPLYHPMQSASKNFKGSLYVFVNGGCLSTAGHCISLLDFYTDAIFIGETPGSTYSCNDFSIQAKLPATGMEVNIPRTIFETAVPDSERKIPFPVDYKIHGSVSDRINGIDSYYRVLETEILPQVHP